MFYRRFHLLNKTLRMRIQLWVYFVLILYISISCSTGAKKNNQNGESAETENEATEAVNMDLFFQSALDGNIHFIRIALDKSVDVNSKDENNRTALMLSAYNGHKEIVDLLIENGADVNLVDDSGRTALMFASSGPFNSTVIELIKAGAKLDFVDNEEHWSALMFAASEGQLEVTKTLTDNGADVNLTDIDGESAYDFAVNNKHSEVADFLKGKM
jgi:uncharacterized protein